MNRIFGDNALGVIVRLVILSVIVGIVMQALNISLPDLLRRAQIFANRIYNLGFGAFRQGFDYFLIGAVVVVPIWIVARLLGALKGGAGK